MLSTKNEPVLRQLPRLTTCRNPDTCCGCGLDGYLAMCGASEELVTEVAELWRWTGGLPSEEREALMVEALNLLHQNNELRLHPSLTDSGPQAPVVSPSGRLLGCIHGMFFIDFEDEGN